MERANLANDSSCRDIRKNYYGHEIEPSFSALRWANSFKSKSHERLKDNLLAAGLPE